MVATAKIGVLCYSTWGHQNTLAQAVFEGIKKVPNCEAILYQFDETLSAEVLTKMSAAPKPNWPIITPTLLAELDGFIICSPGRYGRICAQASTFFDKCGSIWAAGKMIGKFGGMVTSVAGQHGGHESTILTTLPFFVHLGIIFVPIGYAKSEVSNEEYISGSSPWGASSVAGSKGNLPVLPIDLEVARFQGQNMATIVSTHLAGKEALAAASATTGTTSTA